MRLRDGFTVDVDSFRLLQDEVGIGKIVELSPADASLIAPYIQKHPETLYTACSGVCLTGQHGVFQHGERQLAVEWVRTESKPKLNEPDCNVYRYLFGVTTNGQCLGFDVTKRESSPTTGQVADHWSTIDEVVKRYCPGT